MIKFTDEMKERINNAFTDKKACVWATASKDGVPSVSFRGSTFVWDDEHLAIWERSRQSGAQHMEENPHVVMLYADLPARIGWRFYGQATVFKTGEMRQKIMDRTIKDELDRDPERKGYGVLVRVDKIRRYSGDEIIQQR
ncbi:MAG: pyridoxamine 5'-phosphate oxidase family protein [candidate division NC10 bacterium]